MREGKEKEQCYRRKDIFSAHTHTHTPSVTFFSWCIWNDCFSFPFSGWWFIKRTEGSTVFRANGTLNIIVCIKYCICSCHERQRYQSIDCVSTGRWCSVRLSEVGGEQQSGLVCESWHPSLSPCYISMTHSISGRAAAGEQCDRGETRGCGLDSTGRSTGGGGEVSERAKAGLKSTRKVFYFSWVTERVWARLKGKAF